MTTFFDLGLSPETLEILEAKGYETPSSIQEKTIPILLNKECDVIGQSQTGTGKTAAFGLPIIENLLKNTNNYDRNIKALILTPTRELAIQVGNEISSFVGKRKLKVFTIYGGQSYITEKRHIKDGIDILVGTPGRIIDHMNNGLLDFSQIEYFVLDEADEMLNMGFIGDIEDILKHTPKTKTTLFFSATMPSVIMNIAKKYMNEYQTLAVKNKQLTTALTDQYYYVVKRQDKNELLSRIIDLEYSFYGIIFCKTKADVDELVNILGGKGYNVDSIHGDISQAQREKTIKRFKNGTSKILVATDVAARGLDINNLSHVINYSIPQSPEDYTHRIGRTGRAGKKGVAITFVSPSEVRKLNFIKSVTSAEIINKKIPEVDEVIKTQINNVKNIVGEMIDTAANIEYIDLAHELLKLDKGEIVLSALLAGFLKDRLSKDKYSEISADDFRGGDRKFERFSERRSDRSDRFSDRRPERGSERRSDRFSDRGDKRFDRYSEDRGSFNRSNKAGSTVRVFVAKGKKDGMSPKKMVDFIADQSGVPSRFIDDMDVMENFSFFSTSQTDAERIVKHFSNSKYGDKPLVSLAKESKRN